MKASLKKLLNKILNWSGFELTWDWRTNNTTDTWIPVFAGTAIQHRAIPANGVAPVEKYGSVWVSGGIYVQRRGNTVFVNGDPEFSQTWSRTRIGTIPSGFRPVGTAYCSINGEVDYLLFNTDGSVQINARGAGRIWFSGTWVIDS